MKDILQEIVDYKRVEVEQSKTLVPPSLLYRRVEELPTISNVSMKASLIQSESGIIAEFKRKSPSKGWIKEEGRADVIPLDYEKNGAAALSILTDRHFFGGDDEYIATARRSGVTIPILYKNFIMLIAAALSVKECRALQQTAHELGMETLLEMHSAEELEYARIEPDLCGINNRNLGSFVTNVENSFRLAELLPHDAVKVSESGISNSKTVSALREAGFRGFLIGENFMKSENPGKALNDFIANL